MPEGDLTLHSHLRMNGVWGTYRRGQRCGQWDDNRTTYWCPGCQR